MLRSLALAASLLFFTGLAPRHAHALGDAALVFVAPSDLSVGYEGLANDLREAGASTVDVTYTGWPGGDLSSRYRLVIVTPYQGPLDPAIADDLAAFAAAGGGVVLVAEHLGGFENGNLLAERIGIAARFLPSDTGPGCSATDAAIAHPLTEGAPTLDFAWGVTVTGGTLIYGSTIPVATVEGTTVLVGDSDAFYDATGLGSCGYGPSTRAFHRNLFTALAREPGPGPGPGGDADVASDAGPSVPGELGASCAAPTDCRSGLCITVGARSYCSAPCDGTCPAPYVCSSAGSSLVCTEPSGGGCSVGRGRGRALLTWLVVALGLLRVRRA